MTRRREMVEGAEYRAQVSGESYPALAPGATVDVRTVVQWEGPLYLDRVAMPKEGRVLVEGIFVGARQALLPKLDGSGVKSLWSMELKGWFERDARLWRRETAFEVRGGTHVVVSLRNPYAFPLPGGSVVFVFRDYGEAS